MTEWVYAPVVAGFKLWFVGQGLRFLERGYEHVPHTGGAVLAANHLSYFDFVFVGKPADPIGRYVRFMAKQPTFDHKVSGPLMRGMHHIPVDREAGAGAYQYAVQALSAGELVGVFPEGTMSRSFTVKTLKTGAARMALETDVPIVPVITWGGHRLWTKGRPRDLRPRGRTISISVGEPLAPEGDPTALTARLRGVMTKLLDETIRAHPDGPDTDEDTWWLPPEYGGTAMSPAQAASIEESERLERLARRAQSPGG